MVGAGIKAQTFWIRQGNLTTTQIDGRVRQIVYIFTRKLELKTDSFELFCQFKLTLLRFVTIKPSNPLKVFSTSVFDLKNTSFPKFQISEKLACSNFLRMRSGRLSSANAGSQIALADDRQSHLVFKDKTMSSSTYFRI